MGRKKTDAKQKLIDTGKVMIFKKAYESVSIQDICEAASVNKGSFYYYFKTKEEFGLQVIEDRWNSFRQFLVQILNNPSKSSTEKLLFFLDGAFNIIRDQKETHTKIVGCPFGNLAAEMSTQSDPLQERLAQVFQDWGVHLELLIQEGITSEEFYPGAPREMAQSLIAYVEGIWLLSKTFDDLQITEKLLNRGTLLIVNR